MKRDMSDNQTLSQEYQIIDYENEMENQDFAGQ